MSTLKSSAEDLTLNADGSGNDVIIQSDGSTKAIITAEGNIGIGDTDPSEAKLSIDNVASGDIGLQIVNAQATKGLYIDQNGDGDALNIDSEATSNAAARINGKYPLIATQDISSGYAGLFYRNLDEAGSYPLIRIIDEHTSNTQPALQIKQDQAQKSIHIDQNGNQDGIFIDGKSGVTSRFGMYIETDSLTSGRGLYVYDNSSSTTSRYLVRIDNDNPASTGCIPLSVKQDSTGLAADFSGTGGIRSAGGILFGTDTAAANALDDYEEGTWTPALSNMTVNGTFTSGGYYRVIGKVQHFTGWFAATTSIVWSASAYITGLPNIGILHNMSAVMNTGFAYHAKGFPLFAGEGNPNRIWIPNTFGTWQPGSGSGYDGGTKVRFGGTQPLA